MTTFTGGIYTSSFLEILIPMKISRKIFKCKKKNKLCRQGGYLAYKTYYTRRIIL
nr:MAG TPA: hypothetical protein [Caudoviricetes sp.]